MSEHVLVISDRADDVLFASQLAVRIGGDMSRAVNRDDFRRFLVARPHSLVVWSADNEESYEAMGEILPKYAKPQRVFAVTDKPLEQYPHLYKYPVFGHHLLRRYDEAAMSIYTRLALAGLAHDPMGIAQYFPEKTPIKRITLVRSGQKGAAIEALQNVLTNKGIKGRIAKAVAQGVDELIINAVFTAPVNADGQMLMKSAARDADFELAEKAQIEVEIAECDTYGCIAVTDRFASLKKRLVMESLRRNYEAYDPTSPDNMTNLRFGIHGVVQLGLSLLMLNEPRDRTQVMLFFPMVDDFKSFRNGFRFFSIISP